jgi:hypothetical protein
VAVNVEVSVEDSTLYLDPGVQIAVNQAARPASSPMRLPL